MERHFHRDEDGRDAEGHLDEDEDEGGADRRLDWDSKYWKEKLASNIFLIQNLQK